MDVHFLACGVTFDVGNAFTPLSALNSFLKTCRALQGLFASCNYALSEVVGEMFFEQIVVRITVRKRR